MTFDWVFFRQTAGAVLAGIPVTLCVILVSLAAAYPLGFFLAVGRMRNGRVSSRLIAVFVSFMRGVPMIVQIYVIYTVMPMALDAWLRGIGSPLNVYDINPLLYALILFAANTTASFSEIFRSALTAVGAGQLEAALACGMSEGQAYRRILCPQMFRAASANLCNSTVDMVKNTSLVFYMSVRDIMGIIKTEAGISYDFFEGYTLAFLLYLVICFAVQEIYRWFGRKPARRRVALERGRADRAAY